MKVDLTTIRQTKVELDNTELIEAIITYIGKKLKVNAKTIPVALFFIDVQKDVGQPSNYTVIVDFNTKTNEEGVWKKKK